MGDAYMRNVDGDEQKAGWRVCECTPGYRLGFAPLFQGTCRLMSPFRTVSGPQK